MTKKIISLLVILLSIHTIMVTIQTINTYQQNERILKNYLKDSTKVIHIDKQKLIPFTNNYVVTFGNITTWEQACIKYFYKKEKEIQLDINKW